MSARQRPVSDVQLAGAICGNLLQESVSGTMMMLCVGVLRLGPDKFSPDEKAMTLDPVCKSVT